MLRKVLFIILLAVVSAEQETGQQNAPNVDEMKRKVEVHNQHVAWLEQSYEGLIKGVALKTLKQVPKSYGPVMVECFELAPDITGRANCVAQAFKNRGSDKPSLLETLKRQISSQTPRSTILTHPNTKTASTAAPKSESGSTTSKWSRWERLSKRPISSTTPETRTTTINPKMQRWMRLAGGNDANLKVISPQNNNNVYDSNQLHRRAKRGYRLTDNQQSYESYLTPQNAQDKLSVAKQENFVLIPETSIGLNTIPDFLRQVFVVPEKEKDENGKTVEMAWKPKWHRFQRLIKLSQFNKDGLERFFDYVGFQEPKTKEEIRMQTLLDSVKVFADVAKKANVSGLSLFSPKLLSVAPTDPTVTHLFSPDVLSLYDDEKPLSFSSVMKALEISDKDAWMDIIMETSGASDTISDILKWMDGNFSNSDFEKHAKVHLRFIEHWDNFMQSFTLEQERQLRDDGFAYIEPYQYDIIYSKIYDKKPVAQDIEFFKSLTPNERDLLLEDSIRQLAGQPDAMRSWDKRMKQALLSPSMFAPAILAPSVLGHVTLSPSLFNPAILSPNALSPGTLSPNIGNPVILSPYVLSPGTLSPYLLSPQVLSPYALAPTVISPYLLGPYVLCPQVLSPALLSPNGLSGNVLSPYALSPGLLSPEFLNANVLSPSVLSRKKRKRRSARRS